MTKARVPACRYCIEKEDLIDALELQLERDVQGRFDANKRIEELQAWKAKAETVLTPGELKTIERMARGA